MDIPPFPPHWFTIFRAGTEIGVTLQPCSTLINANQWRLFPEGLRTSDLVSILESLAKEPDNCSLVLAYVDTIDSAHYLMESGRVALAAFDGPTRDHLFSRPVVSPSEADRPTAPLPPGHPDSFPMEALREELHGKAPTPDDRPAECGFVMDDQVCILPAQHTGLHYSKKQPVVWAECPDCGGLGHVGIHLCVACKGECGAWVKKDQPTNMKPNIYISDSLASADPKRITRIVRMVANIYLNEFGASMVGGRYATRDAADAGVVAGQKRFACIDYTREVCEGEGL